jgi:hypothetical protein
MVAIMADSDNPLGGVESLVPVTDEAYQLGYIMEVGLQMGIVLPNDVVPLGKTPGV